MITTAICYIPTRSHTPNIANPLPFSFKPNRDPADDETRTRDLRTTNAVTTKI